MRSSLRFGLTSFDLVYPGSTRLPSNDEDNVEPFSEVVVFQDAVGRSADFLDESRAKCWRDVSNMLFEHGPSHRNEDCRVGNCSGIEDALKTRLQNFKDLVERLTVLSLI